MVTPVISQMTTPYPDKGQTQVVFDTNVDGLMSLFDSLTSELPPALTWIQDRVDEVAATAMAGDLPDMTGKAGNYIRVNAGETAGELRTPAQVLLDLGSGNTGRAVFESETDAEAQAVMGLGSNATLEFADLINTTAEWEAGTAPDYGYITPAQLKAAFKALNPIKANVTFDGRSATFGVQRSSGVASVTRVSLGIYEITLSEAMPNLTYGVLATGGDGTGDNRMAAHYYLVSTTVFRVYFINHANGILQDTRYVTVSALY